MIKARSVSSGCSLSARCQKHLPREAPSGITGRGFSSPDFSWRMTLTLRKTVIKGEAAHGDYLVLDDGRANDDTASSMPSVSASMFCMDPDRADERS